MNSFVGRPARLAVLVAMALVLALIDAQMLPPRIIRTIRPIGIRTLVPRVTRTTSTPITTPSMVDTSTWNFTNPSAIARQCLNNLSGQSVVSFCQNRALSDWSADRVGTNKSTTWETCCSLFDELDCYTKNAANFCKPDTGKALIAYAQKVANYFHQSVCKSVSFVLWKSNCNNDTHAVKVRNMNNTQNKYPSLKPQFISLPPDDGPERSCFTKLRTSRLPTNTNTRVNLEQKCVTASLDKWDPSRRKLLESVTLESCCAIYDSLDCVVRQASSSCTTAEQTDMANYRRKSMTAFQATICKGVTTDQCVQQLVSGALNATTAATLVGPKGSATAHLPSLTLTALFVALLLVR